MTKINAPQRDGAAAGNESPKGKPGKRGPGQNSLDNENSLVPNKQCTQVDVLQWLPSGGSLEETGLSKGAFLTAWSRLVERNSEASRK